MLIKAGVDIGRLSWDIRRKLTIIEKIIAGIEGEELVVTSTYEGNHLPSSKHYANEAIDIRIFKKPEAVKIEIARCLGHNYFVYLGKNHIHIGYDPK